MDFVDEVVKMITSPNWQRGSVKEFIYKNVSKMRYDEFEECIDLLIDDAKNQYED